MNYLIIDFGGTLAKYSVMDEICHIHLTGEEKAPVETKQAFLDFLCRLYEETGRDFDLGGIAVSMPGVIDGQTGFVKSAGAYLALYGMNLIKELSGRIPVPVTVENDGKCGALAEVWQGNLADCDDGIVLILGTGVAGGMIKDRKIHRGKNLSAGEFSYFLLGAEEGYRNTALCKCGVSTLLFEAMRRKGIDVKKSPHYGLLYAVMNCEQTLTACDKDPQYDRGMDGFQFFSLLDEGDPIITQLYAEYTHNIAVLLYNLQLIYAPEKILIGGGISRQQRLIPDIRVQYEKIQESIRLMFDVPCLLDVCRFGNEANQYGALYHFLRQNVMREAEG